MGKMPGFAYPIAPLFRKKPFFNLALALRVSNAPRKIFSPPLAKIFRE
jgi:hypothetical protein